RSSTVFRATGEADRCARRGRRFRCLAFDSRGSLVGPVRFTEGSPVRFTGASPVRFTEGSPVRFTGASPVRFTGASPALPVRLIGEVDSALPVRFTGASL